MLVVDRRVTRHEQQGEQRIGRHEQHTKVRSFLGTCPEMARASFLLLLFFLCGKALLDDLPLLRGLLKKSPIVFKLIDF